ncbi:hydrogen peroxide-inducible genes activator [Pinisolibacter sp.]|uniref:hydrogen peroxide-inducible genes activator n=1 Tax=Pinisolibacter sp. TaxID=2172024 RepID=UPI002FDD2AA5
MTDITLKHLRYFEALAHHGHFGRAAEACAISQPALSLQIKELEEILGSPLVERGARQIRPTALGDAMAVRAREVLRAVEELEEMARAFRDPFSGRLRLGAIPTVAPYLLSGVVRALADRYPGMDVRPREAVTRTLVEELLGGRLDAALVALPISEPSLVEHALLEEEFVLVRPTRDADAPVPNTDELRGIRLLLLEEGHCFREQAIAYCRIPAGTVRDTMQGSSLSTLVQMVDVGLGVTLIPEMAVKVESRAAAVAVARLPVPQPTRVIGMVWRRTNPMADHLKTIAGVVRQVAHETGLSGGG